MSIGYRGLFTLKPTEVANFDASELVVILGFGQMSQVLLATFLTTPLATGIYGEAEWPFVAFDLDPSIVKHASSKLGFPILYGDGSRAALLQSVGISSPKDVMVIYEGRQRALEAVERIRLAFPATYSPTSRKCRWPPQFETFIALVLPGSTNAMGIETSIALVLPVREHECDTSFVLGRPPALS
ncbi:K(+) efflux antiporter 3, chloroplastic [Tanacetum coccineum]